ncbi:MAG TPA: hypothetical protein VD905_03920 [Flavobacteriales bacterium]|nr:hypothetical protein [Flavobacteriales bacterium]
MEFLNHGVLESAREVAVVYIDLKKETRLDMVEIEISLESEIKNNQYLRVEGFTRELNSLGEGLVFGTFTIYKDKLKINFKSFPDAGKLYVNALKFVSFAPVKASVSVYAEQTIPAQMVQKPGNGFLRAIGYLSL